MADDEFDFEYQLQQEAVEKLAQADKKQNQETDIPNPYVYRDPSDGTEYEWDHLKKAWFPKIDENFIAHYQATYGNFSANDNEEKNDVSKDMTKSIEDENLIKEKDTDGNEDNEEENLNRKRPIEETPQWFEIDDQYNTNVYVSNLPLDITEEEFITLMKKCGFIAKDEKNKLKIKLYKDENGQLKGDGRCSYIKVESVDLALRILDGYYHRGNIIKVELAKFSLKGEYDPTKKPKKKKLNKKEKEKQKRKLEKLFDWRPDKILNEKGKHEKCVVIKNFFDPQIFERDPKLIMDYRVDLQEECEEKCGQVKRVVIYDLHPEGVVMVTFKEFEDAGKCVELMNGRFFAGRKLDAQLWDGKTKYKIEETEEEMEKRMNKWYEHLEQEEDPQTKPPTTQDKT